MDTAKTIVQAMVISKLDYCNSLYINLPATQINKLQGVMNEAARLVTLTPSSEHITPALIRLHWLPVVERINYKVITMVFKGLHNMCPTYISELLVPHKPNRTLRSSSQNLLVEPRYRLSSAG